MSSFFLGDMWNEMASKHTPELSFSRSGMTFDAWREKALAKLTELLGPEPEPVDLCPSVESEEDLGDVLRRRVILHTDAYTLLPCWVTVPKERNGKAPAILCSHGHGPFGKNSVAGIRSAFGHPGGQ